VSRVGTGRRNRIWSDRPTDDGAGSLHECRPGPATHDRALIASPVAAAAAAAAADLLQMSSSQHQTGLEYIGRYRVFYS